MLLIPVMVLGQVGINTTSPTNTLDVNGTARVRTLTQDLNPTKLVTADVLGVLGYTNFNGGSDTYPPIVLQDTIKEGPAYQVITDPFFIEDADLGLEHTITIPDGKSALITVSFKVPWKIVMASTNSTNIAGHIGAQLWRNNTILYGIGDQQLIPVNVTLPGHGGNSDYNPIREGSVGNQFTEIINDVVDGNDTIITYEVTGMLFFLEQTEEDPISIRFGTQYAQKLGSPSFLRLSTTAVIY